MPEKLRTPHATIVLRELMKNESAAADATATEEAEEGDEEAAD